MRRLRVAPPRLLSSHLPLRAPASASFAPVRDKSVSVEGLTFRTLKEVLNMYRLYITQGEMQRAIEQVLSLHRHRIGRNHIDRVGDNGVDAPLRELRPP